MDLSEDLPIGGSVVLDVNTLVNAAPYWVRHGEWPECPPDSPPRPPAEACALGICRDAIEWTLWLSPKIRDLVVRVLSGEIGRQFAARPLSEAAISDYLDELDWIATASGGGCIKPRARVEAIGDEEDDKNILSLAVSIPARVIVSADGQMTQDRIRTLPTSEGPERFWLVTPEDFVSEVTQTRLRYQAEPPQQ